jgi:putative FmdB family regulatory protein
MPFYEYKCTKCGEKFEIRRGFFASSKDKAICPKCGATETERVYSPFGTGTRSDNSNSCPPIRHFG